ncbi:hypothetical protein B4U79_10245, partial [Dinothrombium tinctorium]
PFPIMSETTCSRQQRKTVVRIRGDSKPPTLPKPRATSVKSLDNVRDLCRSPSPASNVGPRSLPAIISHYGYAQKSSPKPRKVQKSSTDVSLPTTVVRPVSLPEIAEPRLISISNDYKRKERMARRLRKEFWAQRNLKYKRPKYRYFSQLYFLFHMATTLCLIRYSENVSIVYGSIALGLIQLITIGLDFAECVQSQFMFLSILQFCFVFLLMHFILSQCKSGGPKYGFNNIAVAHLLITQASLWIVNFDAEFGLCGYRNYVSNKSSNNTFSMALELKIKREHSLPSTFADMLLPIIHHFQILIIFLLLTIWINCNERKSLYALRSSSAETTNNPIYKSSVEPVSVKGFFLGLLVVSAALIVLLHGDNEILLITHISIQ